MQIGIGRKAATTTIGPTSRARFPVLRNAGDDVKARAPLINTSTHRSSFPAAAVPYTHSYTHVLSPPPPPPASRYGAEEMLDAANLDVVPLRGDNVGP